MIDKESYFKRELIGAVIAPVVWIIIAALFIWQGLVKPEQVSIYWNIALINIIAAAVSFLVSYRIIFGGF